MKHLHDGNYVANYRYCELCRDGPEAAVVHPDCLQLFLRRCPRPEALDLLWLAAVWRVPWRSAANTQLYDRGDKLTPVVLTAMEKLLGAPLSLLPPELIYAIQGYSALSLCWKYSAVVDIADELSGAEQTALRTLPLCQVLEWERGRPPVLTTASKCPPVVRVAIDSRGVQKVESLERYTSPDFSRSDGVVYVVQDRHRFEDVLAHFKVCCLLLPFFLFTHRWRIKPHVARFYRTAPCAYNYRQRDSDSGPGMYVALPRWAIASYYLGDLR